MKYLDSCPEIANWSYEKIFIPYVSNVRTGKVRKYYPDFFVENKDGSKFLVEIKPSKKLSHVTVRKKINAAEMWCRDHGVTYRIITEFELKDMNIILRCFICDKIITVITKILGLDVSTSCIGVCIINAGVEPDNSGSHISYLDRIEFKGCKTMWEKADAVSSSLRNIKNSYFFCGKEDENVLFALEEPLLGFSKGMSSAGTITTLMRFNGIVSYIGRNTFSVDPTYISAATARKACGIKLVKRVVGGPQKEQVFKYMSENDLKHVTWPKKKSGADVDWSRDATDAYVIARAAYIVNK